VGLSAGKAQKKGKRSQLNPSAQLGGYDRVQELIGWLASQYNAPVQPNPYLKHQPGLPGPGPGGGAPSPFGGPPAGPQAQTTPAQAQANDVHRQSIADAVARQHTPGMGEAIRDQMPDMSGMYQGGAGFAPAMAMGGPGGGGQRPQAADGGNFPTSMPMPQRGLMDRQGVNIGQLLTAPSWGAARGHWQDIQQNRRETQMANDPALMPGAGGLDFTDQMRGMRPTASPFAGLNHEGMAPVDPRQAMALMGGYGGGGSPFAGMDGFTGLMY
jgi:hypothetical protein